jgi:hypothetical protein
MTGIYGFGAVVRHTVRRHGAAVARGIHNPEDTGSKPVAGIYSLWYSVKPLFFITRRDERPLCNVSQGIHPGR